MQELLPHKTIFLIEFTRYNNHIKNILQASKRKCENLILKRLILNLC